MEVESYKGQNPIERKVDRVLETWNLQTLVFDKTKENLPVTLGDVKRELAEMCKKELKNPKEFLDIATKNPQINKRLKAQNPQEIQSIIISIITEHNQRISNEQKKAQNRERQIKINKEIKEVGPKLIQAIKNGEISIIVKQKLVTLTLSNFKYALTNPGQIRQILNSKINPQYQNIIKLLGVSPTQFNTLIGDIQAINYRNELPENKQDWQNALEGGAKELTTIFINNKKLIAKLIGRKEEDINEEKMRDLRVFLLKNGNVLQSITQQLNYDDESKKIKGGKENKEKNDTSDYTFRLIEQYHISLDKSIDDGGTGIGFIIKNYTENPQNQVFCHEYEQKIRPMLNQQLQDKITQEKQKNKELFKDNENNVQTIEDLVKPFKRAENKKACTNIFTELGNSLNKNNQTEALKRQPMTPESIARGEKLKGVFGDSFEKILQGTYFQKELQNKLNDLGKQPQIQSFLQIHPELSSLLKVENLANLNIGSLEESGKKLLNLIGKIFFSEKAGEKYRNTDTDDEEAVRITVDSVFEEALNDENLFAEFIQGADFNLEGDDFLKMYENEEVLTDNNIPEILGDFDKLHDGVLSRPIENLAKEHIKDESGDLQDIFKLKVGKNLNELFDKLYQGFTARLTPQHQISIFPEDLFTSILDLSKRDGKENPSFNRTRFEDSLTMNGISIQNFDKYQHALEEEIKKIIDRELEQESSFKEIVDTSLHKIMISDRVSYTIAQLKDSPFTKGLTLDMSKADNITMDENLDVIIKGMYDGEPCYLCINSDGTVTITGYNYQDQDIMTFDNSPNFPLFQIPSIKEQEEVGYTTLKKQGNRTQNDRKEVYHQFQENHTLKEGGLEDFPLQKERGLVLLKIKELSGITENLLTSNYQDKPYQFFTELATSMTTPDIARKMNRFMDNIQDLAQQVQEGNVFIHDNAPTFASLFRRDKMQLEYNIKNFTENPYVLILQHFLKKNGNEATFKIDDALAWVDSFQEGDVACQDRNDKIFNGVGDDYQGTPLTAYLKNLQN